MKSRAIEQSPIVKSRKISPPKPSTATKSEGYHKNCLPSPAPVDKPRIPSAQSPSVSSNLKKPVDKKEQQPKPIPPIPTRPLPSPSVSSNLNKPVDKKEQPKPILPTPTRPLPTAGDKSRPSSVKPSALSTSSKKSPSKKVLAAPIQQKVTRAPSRLESSLLREDVQRWTGKLKQVSTSVLQIATCKRPVGARSLEALINLEISNSLGDALNDPVFAQGFVQATRSLLEELNRLDESGKLNPKLLREEAKKKKPYIRANSATTVCYRDRYFKELVMNVLQSMTSSEIEEEVAGKAVRSDESRERIRVIRDMVRTEAGLEPEEYRALERRLEELRRSLSKNRLEMEKAASEVDQIISRHVVRGEQSLSSLQIPQPAKEKLRSCYKRLETGSDGGECKNGTGCSKKTTDSKGTVASASEKYKKSLDKVGEPECFEKGNSDEIQNIRPQLKHLVHEELLRLKMKEEEIINRDREFDRNLRLGDTPKSSFESVEFKSAASNVSADDEGETSEEETRTLLEALKAEIEERKITDEELRNCGPQGVCIRVLERIEEGEDELNYKDTTEETSSSTSSQSKLSSSTSGIAPKVLHCDETLLSAKQHSNNSLGKQPSENSLVERVKSKCFYKEKPEVKNVLDEMKDAFETFKVMDDVFSAFKVSEKPGQANEATMFDKDFHLWDLTVGEVANVLVNISGKINRLPKYFQETSSSNFTEERKQVIDVLCVLEKCMNASKTEELDVTVSSDKASFSIERIAETFSFLSNTLNSSPREMKSESISVLNPPKSLIETLNTLSSTAYFRDCFTSPKHDHSKRRNLSKDVEVVKPYNMNEIRSSGEILNFDQKVAENKRQGNRKKIYFFTRDKKRPDDLNENISKFEHFMGQTASIMTIQNVSDMFLFLSAVLNDVPDRLKSEKILDLDPPPSLLTALNILYCEDDTDSMTDLEKKKSFGSLTIQNVSDFFLTLSKTFDDAPERLKESTVAELKPPQSLLRAISLLTSLSHLSIPESYSQEIEHEVRENISTENHEKFFDAVASLGSVNS